MDSRSVESQHKDDTKLLRRLSVSKKDCTSRKKATIKENSSSKNKGLSIASFFKNTPPSKLACPLCGRFVPRFKINEHIDSQCREYSEQNDFGAQDKTPTKSPTHSNDFRGPDVEEKSTIMQAKNEESNTSLYFEKNNMARQESPKRNCQAKEIKKVSIGKLSSKLSKKVLVFSEDSINNSEVAAVDEPDFTEASSSQKENFDASTNPPHAEKSEAPLPELESPETVASSRIMKRKKEDFSVTQADPILLKKPRHAENKNKNKSFSIFSQTQSSHCSTSPNNITKDILPEVRKSPDEKVEEKKTIEPQESNNPENDATSTAAHPPLTRQPYYLQNFLAVLEAVLENEDDRVLFNSEDLSHIHNFKQLSGTEHFIYCKS